MPSDKYSIDYLLRRRTPSPRFDTTNTDCYLIDEHLQICQHLDDDVMASSGIITSSPIPSSSNHHHRRVYNCQRCLNHNRRQIRKNHKTKCLYQHCNCDKCQMVDKRRELNHKLVEIDGIKLLHSITKELNCTSTIRERQPKCQRCAGHAIVNRLKGHKQLCPYKNCECDKCALVVERQNLMAKQIKERRRQKKHKELSTNIISNDIDRLRSEQEQMPVRICSTSTTSIWVNCDSTSLSAPISFTLKDNCSHFGINYDQPIIHTSVAM